MKCAGKNITAILCAILLILQCMLPSGALSDTGERYTVNKNRLTMGVGERYSLAKGTQAIKSATRFYWMSDNSKVAAVSKDGTVTAISKGSADITLRTRARVLSVYTVTVKSAPVSVRLNKSSLKLGVGERYDLDSYVNRGAGALWRAYSSSNERVVQVDRNGKVTAKAQGTAVITVSLYNGVKSTCSITVCAEPSYIKLSKGNLTLGKKEKYDLDSYVNSGAAANTRRYTSTNTNVADVTANGVVTAKGEGTAIISVRVYNGASASCIVTVKKEPTRITLNKKNITLKKGNTFDLDSYVNSGAAACVRVYTTSNSSVATVDNLGVVTAKKEGKAVIRCTIYNGLYAECTVTVGAPFERIRTNLDPNKPMVALTFDDGPNPATTTRVLDALQKHNARATFFVVGNRLGSAESRVLKRAYDMGCEIGNHTYSHKYLNQEKESAVISEIKKCNEAIYNAIGAYPTAFRSPGGNTTKVVEKHVKMPIFYWSIDTRDWETQSANSSYNHVINNVSDGDIVLMHDIYSPSASAAEMIIPKLIKMGYQLVTLHELAYYKGVNFKNGVTYYSIR